MCGAVTPLPLYVFMAWYSVKAQGLYLYPQLIDCKVYKLCVQSKCQFP